MIIKITNFGVGIHEFRFEKSVQELQLEKPFVDNLVLDCKLDKSQHQIVINCNLTFSTSLNCDRCGSKFNEEFNSDFTLLYLFEQNELDEDETNVHYLAAKEDKIDLKKDVLDYAKISVPMKKLCSEDCKGLCSMCGTDLNQNECKCKDEEINPVWGELLKLKDNLN